MIYNIIGLTFYLMGLIVFFKFGILSDNLWEHILMNSGMSEKDEKKHKVWSKVAMGCLILGFVFQLLGLTMQHFNDKKITTKEFENLNLGVDYNETTGIKGNLMVKFNENKVMYQLQINGKEKSIDSIQKFTIELEDKDGFKISEIDIPNTAENTELSNLVKKDSVFLKVKGTQKLSAKNYLQIKNWELLMLKNNYDK